MTKRKVILTGFEPFGNYEFNPTKESALYFNSKTIDGTKVIGVVLPCTYFGAFEVLDEIVDREKPDAIISTGLSSSVKAIRIETTFHNIMNGKYPDADGSMPDNLPIWKGSGAKDILLATADNHRLANVLKANNIPVELSTNAEGYICNSLGFLITKEIRTNLLWTPKKNAFIHIPWTNDFRDRIDLSPDKIFLEKEKYYKAIRLLIKNI